MNKINWFWKCDFIDGEGNTVSKMLSASTTLGAKKRAFEVGRNFGLEPKYDTIRQATDKEIREFKKMIKARTKKSK